METRIGDHRVTIERRERSHKAVCACGWRSHLWNELRPAEADAWHHVYGDDVIVDLTSVPDHEAVTQEVPRVVVQAMEERRSGNVRDLVRQAQDMAAQPSPYSRDSARELFRSADRDTVTVRAAVTEIEELLARHERQSSGAADSEWLQLITAKRLLLQALELGDEAGTRRALI